MTLKSYLLIIKAIVLVSFITLIIIVQQIDPDKSGYIGQLLFYSSSFLFLSSFFILILTLIRKKFNKNEEFLFVCLSVSFRQGILFAILFLIFLIFQQNRIFVWWSGLLVVAGMLLVELHFLTKK